MEKNLLERIQMEINYILEHEDGLSHHDKVELHRLLQEKKKYEAGLSKLEINLQKFTDEVIKS